MSKQTTYTTQTTDTTDSCHDPQGILETLEETRNEDPDNHACMHARPVHTAQDASATANTSTGANTDAITTHTHTHTFLWKQQQHRMTNNDNRSLQTRGLRSIRQRSCKPNGFRCGCAGFVGMGATPAPPIGSLVPIRRKLPRNAHKAGPKLQWTHRRTS